MPLLQNSQSQSPSFCDHLAVGQVVNVSEGEAGDGLLVGGVRLPHLKRHCQMVITVSVVTLSQQWQHHEKHMMNMHIPTNDDKYL